MWNGRPSWRNSWKYANSSAEWSKLRWRYNAVNYIYNIFYSQLTHMWYKWYWHNKCLEQYDTSNKLHINSARSQPYPIFLQCCMEYCVILERVMTAPDCIKFQFFSLFLKNSSPLGIAKSVHTYFCNRRFCLNIKEVIRSSEFSTWDGTCPYIFALTWRKWK